MSGQGLDHSVKIADSWLSCYAALNSCIPGQPVLVELRLENYAVIDNLAVEFAAGLNLLTGETGAGKSILIDALALLLGEKASTDVIRTGAERAVISAVFEIEERTEKTVARILEANGIDPTTKMIRHFAAGNRGGWQGPRLRQQPARYGRSAAATCAVSRDHPRAERIHPVVRCRGAAGTCWMHLPALSSMRPARPSPAGRALPIASKNCEHGEQDRLRLLDLWTFQKREIEDAKLQPGEDERLETEKRVLANAEKIYSAAMNAFDLLYEGSASTSSSLRTAQKHIEELSRYEPKFREALAAIDTARISVEDVGATLRDYAGGIQASPEHLAEVEDRLALLDRLKRKYGPTLEDVIQHGEEVSRKLSEMENKDEILAQLRSELAQAAEEYLRAARAISKKRYEAARKLEKLVEAEINDLAMKSNFHIEVSGTDEAGNWTASGFDQVVYLITTNPGEPLRRLEHIASGGELSRVMLALKASVEAGQSKKKTQCATHACVRRNRYRHRRTRGRSRG